MAPQQNQIVSGARGDTTINVQKLLDRPWYKYPHLRRLYGWLSVVLLVQATNGLDGSIMNGMQTLTYWQRYFHHPTGAQLGLFNGTQGLGAVAAQFFLWWLVEKIGRKLTIIIGAVIIILGVFLQSFANGLAMVHPHNFESIHMFFVADRRVVCKRPCNHRYGIELRVHCCPYARR
jgi:hypothetical protein